MIWLHSNKLWLTGQDGFWNKLLTGFCWQSSSALQQLENAVFEFEVKSNKNTLDRLVRKMLFKKNQNIYCSLRKGYSMCKHKDCTKYSLCHSLEILLEESDK